MVLFVFRLLIVELSASSPPTEFILAMDSSRMPVLWTHLVLSQGKKSLQLYKEFIRVLLNYFLCRSVEDAELLFEILKGKDEKDSTSTNPLEFPHSEGTGLKGINIGIPKVFSILSEY